MKYPHRFFVLFAVPDGLWSRQQMRWADRHFDPERIKTFDGRDASGKLVRDMIANRNRMVRDMLIALPPSVTEIVYMDHDITPLDEHSDRVFDVDADIVGCRYPTSNTNAWSAPDIFHNGFVRIKRRVLETLKPPWFTLPYTDDGCALRSCECIGLRDRALAAGFTVANTGHAEHRGDQSWMH